MTEIICVLWYNINNHEFNFTHYLFKFFIKQTDESETTKEAKQTKQSNFLRYLSKKVAPQSEMRSLLLLVTASCAI